MDVLRALRSYYHVFSILSFVVGFTIDTIILKRIDALQTYVILSLYVTVALLAIVASHVVVRREWYRERVAPFVPFVAQYAFGGLFSGLLLFYSQAGSIIGSWPYIALIIVLVVCNELYASYHARLSFQLVLLYFCIVSTLVYLVPIIIGSVGVREFASALVVASGIYVGVVLALHALNAQRLRSSIKESSAAVAVVTVLIVVLYVTNFVPPLPLFARDSGLYQSVERQGALYRGAAYVPTLYERVFGMTLTGPIGQSISFYSAVFAPTRITTPIVHHYEYRTERGWEERSRIAFPVTGGRDAGYRGYSTRPLTEYGRWRVSVETSDGRLIARTYFTFISGAPRAPAPTETIEADMIR